MDGTSLVQVRVPDKVKDEATDILSGIGMDLSTYINLLLNRLIEQEEEGEHHRLAYPYSSAERIDEICATFGMEGMNLSRDDINMLKAIEADVITTDEARDLILRTL